MANASNRSDVYARVTARIVSDLEAGVRPWFKPWRCTAPTASRPLRHNGTPYRGINVVLLWIEAFQRGFGSPTWMTYKQAQQLGGQVRKGESGSLVVYADRYTKTDTEADGIETAHEIAFMKGYTVFNLDQIDGLQPEQNINEGTNSLPPDVETFFAQTGAIFEHGGDRAFYSPLHDKIRLPKPEAFVSARSYAATKAHELIHWTGHTSRLARDFGGKRFGDAGYAIEELVAELGAAFICADLAITPEVQPDHAPYVASWLQTLNNDKRLIFTAAAHAQRAADFLHALLQNGTDNQ